MRAHDTLTNKGMLLDSTPVFDVIGVGCVAVDELISVASYPSSDTKAQIRHQERQCGGLVATALVTAARLGAKCAYAGALGSDDLSAFALDSLRKENIDVSHVISDCRARPIHSYIVVSEDQGTRTILFDSQGIVEFAKPLLCSATVRLARVLLIDHFNIDEKIKLVSMAKEAGVEVVADFEDGKGEKFTELLELIDHLILSLEFGRNLTGKTVPEEVVKQLWNEKRTAVVLTGGKNGCWYMSQEEPFQARHFPAYIVETVDTTGCGDVFHGAYAFALAQDNSVETCLRVASATAAIKATHRGGQNGIPNLHEVAMFLERTNELVLNS